MRNVLVLPAIILSFAAVTAIAGGEDTALPLDPAHNFSGFYFGAGAGFSNQYVKHTVYTGPNQTGGYVVKRYHGDFGAAIQGLAGYNYAFNQNWLAGLTLNGEYDTNNESVGRSSGAMGPNGSFNINWQVGLSAQIGYAPYQRSMYYFGIGPEWGNFKHSYSVNSATQFNRESVLTGGRFAIGARQLICDSLLLGEELNYTYYSSMSMNHQADGGSSILEPQVVSAVVTLSYRFA